MDGLLSFRGRERRPASSRGRAQGRRRGRDDDSARTQHEVSIDEISRLSPVLLAFLRHTGCTFAGKGWLIWRASGRKSGVFLHRPR